AREAASRHALPVPRRLPALVVAAQHPFADRVLECRDDPRYGRLRQTQFPRRLVHAAVPGDRHEYLKVAQAEAVADLAVPIDLSDHGTPTSWYPKKVGLKP